MKAIPLITDERGALVTKWSNPNEGYIIGYGSSRFSRGNAQWNTFDPSECYVYPPCSGINVYNQNKDIVKIYVSSVSGATEESDTGDGSMEHPFSCFKSALRYLSAEYYPALKSLGASITGCYCEEEHVAQIIVTGIVDYPIHNNPGYIQLDRVLITGNGMTSFQLRNACDIINLAKFVNVQNCTVIGSEGFFRGSIGSVCVFENCKVYTPCGLPNSFLHDFVLSDTLLLNSEFHAVINSSYLGIIELGHLYNSYIYVENGVLTDNISFDVFAVDSCQNLLQSTVGEDSYARFFLFVRSTISGIDYDVVWS